jgi:hypothetical protein
VSRPLIDEQNVMARLAQVGGEAAADRAGAQNDHLLVHDAPTKFQR